MSLSPSAPELPLSMLAGLALATLPLLRHHALPAPTAATVLAALKASKTSAYKAKAAIEASLPGLVKPPGRPTKLDTPAPIERRGALHQELLAFVFDNPGCVTGSDVKRRYSIDFRLLVLEMAHSNQDIELQQFAAIVGVPLPTLKDWLRGETPQVDHGGPTNLTAATAAVPALPLIETVLHAWADWKGGFRPFCSFVQFQLRIPFSRQLISDILEAQGVRIPKRRSKSPDASALRDGFLTFFPGAQWVGDGTQLTVTINEQPFIFNLELHVDTHTSALVGASIRPTEDAQAVIEALDDGTQTTGKAPMALLLDNKPSNHSEAVEQALDDTLLIRSRPYTPTDKPHGEGAFGLFAQQAPPLNLNASNPEDLAKQLAILVVTTWARTLNHKPRGNRDGKSRVDLYGETPTEEEKAAAIQALRQRQQQQERLRQSLANRQDPIKRALLQDAFERLNLDDHKGHILTGIASWPIDPILAGIAIFEGRRAANTLPEGVDARYLLGIVRNIAQEEEGMAIATALLKARLAAQDLSFTFLETQREQVEEGDDGDEPDLLIARYLDLALKATRKIDRSFWLLATADVIMDTPPEEHRSLLRLAARRVHATQHVPHKQRLAAVRFLFAKVICLD